MTMSSSPAETASPADTVPLIQVDDLVVVLGDGSSARRVLDHVTLEIGSGRILGLVGESGSGKSTLAKALVGLVRPVSGRMQFDGVDVASARSRRRGRDRGGVRVQLVPQDPYSSLDPRRTVAQTLAEAIDPRRARVAPLRDRIVRLLEQVSLEGSVADRYPHQFSGGQRQRIAIARALAADPQFLVADEITSALDLTTQAGILELLDTLRRELSLTVLFVSHDLAVVRQISDDVCVLLHGKVVEQGPAASILTAPQHDYTRRLLASVPGSPGFSLARTPGA